MSNKKDTKKKSKKMSRLSKIAKDATKAGVKAGITAGKKVKETIDEVSEEIKEERDKAVQRQQETPQRRSDTRPTTGFSQRTVSHNILSADGIEQQIYSMYGWFWSIIVYVFVIMISFVISSSDGRFKFLPIVLLIGFPFYLFWAMINAIPEVKIGRWTIFSRKDLSLRNQLSFGRTIARTFSREMIRNSPEGALIIGIFLLLLAWVLISPFF